MFLLTLMILSIAAVAGSITWLSRTKKSGVHQSLTHKVAPYAVIAVSTLMFTISLVSTSLIIVAENSTAHFVRNWGGTALTPGQKLATTPMGIFTGQKGPQSETILPGIHFKPLYNILYTRASKEEEKLLTVPSGKFAVLVARDGRPMTGDRMLAPAWADEQFNQMLLDAQYFLTEGNGMKGIQYTVIPSGDYHINNFLWDVVKFVPEQVVGTGEVAVIRSNINLDANKNCTPIDETTAVPLVPVGCKGVWDLEVDQGTYRFNPSAVTHTIISVRQNTNDHQGNYTRKQIAFTTDKEGNIVPRLTDEAVAQGKSIDEAIDIRAEGWNIDQDVSVFWQVIDAPRAVAELKDQENIAQFISRVTQSQFRVVAQGKDISECERVDGKPDEYKDKECAAVARKATDLIYHREPIEKQTQIAIQEEVSRYGIRINKVTMGRPNIPPELLMPSLRTQYAENMRRTFEEEERTAQKRIAVQNANELANRQHVLVEADLQNQAAKKEAERIVRLAEARKQAAFNEAQGQERLMSVVGKENVQQQILIQKILDAAIKCPDCIKTPMVTVDSSGGGGTLEGAAAILGSSNFTNMMRTVQTPTK